MSYSHTVATDRGAAQGRERGHWEGTLPDAVSGAGPPEVTQGPTGPSCLGRVRAAHGRVEVTPGTLAHRAASPRASLGLRMWGSPSSPSPQASAQPQPDPRDAAHRPCRSMRPCPRCRNGVGGCSWRWGGLPLRVRHPSLFLQPQEGVFWFLLFFSMFIC